MINLTPINYTIPQQETISALTCSQFFAGELVTQLVLSLFIGFLLLVLFWIDKPLKELTKTELTLKILIVLSYGLYILKTLVDLRIYL